MLKKMSPFSLQSKIPLSQRSAVVHVVLVRAINLPKMNKNGVSSDPYCELSLGTKTGKSKMISECVNPEWREDFDFNWYKGFGDVLNITVYNKYYIDLPLDVQMGHVEFHLKDMEIEKTHQMWKTLQNDGEDNGQIFILLTISGTTSDESISNLKTIENKLERYYYQSSN